MEKHVDPVTVRVHCIAVRVQFSRHAGYAGPQLSRVVRVQAF